MQVPLIAQDKANHFTWGALATAVALSIAMAAELVARFAGVLENISPMRWALVGFLFCLVVARWKEWVHDARTPGHTVDVRDFWATLAGGANVAGPVFAAGALQ